MKWAADQSSHAEGGKLLLRMERAPSSSSDVKDNSTVCMGRVADTFFFGQMKSKSFERRGHAEDGRLLWSIDAQSCSWCGRLPK